MRIIFIDETQNTKDPIFYGVCGISMDDSHYSVIAREITSSFKNVGWDINKEFKGNQLFSSSKGDLNVTIEKRIEFAQNIIASTIGKQNARLKAVFVWNKDGGSPQNHLYLCKRVIELLLKKRKKVLTMEPCLVFIDQNQKIDTNSLGEVLNGTLLRMNYCLIEDINIHREWKHTHIGLCICDLVAYLASWKCLNDNVKEAQINLFEYEKISQNVQKAQTTQNILSNIGKITIKYCEQ
jgi:hypothetical protein